MIVDHCLNTQRCKYIISCIKTIVVKGVLYSATNKIQFYVQVYSNIACVVEITKYTHDIFSVVQIFVMMYYYAGVHACVYACVRAFGRVTEPMTSRRYL